MPVNSSLIGPEENQKGIFVILKYLEPLLPCPKRKAIAYLHLKTGHTTRYVREEVIEPLIDASFLLDDGVTISLPNGSKNISLTFRDVTPEKKALPNTRKKKQDVPALHVNSDGSIDDGELPTDGKGNHMRPKRE